MYPVLGILLGCTILGIGGFLFTKYLKSKNNNSESNTLKEEEIKEDTKEIKNEEHKSLEESIHEEIPEEIKQNYPEKDYFVYIVPNAKQTFGKNKIIIMHKDHIEYLLNSSEESEKQNNLLCLKNGRHFIGQGTIEFEKKEFNNFSSTYMSNIKYFCSKKKYNMSSNVKNNGDLYFEKELISHKNDGSIFNQAMLNYAKKRITQKTDGLKELIKQAGIETYEKHQESIPENNNKGFWTKIFEGIHGRYENIKQRFTGNENAEINLHNNQYIEEKNAVH